MTDRFLSPEVTTAKAESAEAASLEAIARQCCAKLLNSKAARAIPKEHAEALVILAFTYGAAWGLDRPDMMEIGDAQIDSNRSAQQ